MLQVNVCTTFARESTASLIHWANRGCQVGTCCLSVTAHLLQSFAWLIYYVCMSTTPVVICAPRKVAAGLIAEFCI